LNLSYIKYKLKADEHIEVFFMNNKEILKQVIALKPDDRVMIVEGILNSLDEPDPKIDAIWAQEAEKRLKAYRTGKLKGIPMEDIFENNT
jgi:putative addiction module component (TIGR02574 family)